LAKMKTQITMAVNNCLSHQAFIDKHCKANNDVKN